MKQILHAVNPDITQGGFWMPLREPLAYSSYGGAAHNAFLHHDPNEAHARSPHDQILYVSRDAGYAEPTSMQWQYLPMKSEECFETNLASKNMKIRVDDLSDHYAAYAELCFGRHCAHNELT